MIEHVLKFLADDLQARLQGKFGDDHVAVHLGTPPSNDGLAQEGAYLTLINVEHDAAARNTRGARGNDGQRVDVSASMQLNLFLLVSTHFPNTYQKSVACLSAIVSQFHHNPAMTAQSSGAMPAGLERLEIEFQNLDLADQHNLWAALGRDHRPCASYRLRFLVLDESLSQEIAPIVGHVPE